MTSVDVIIVIVAAGIAIYGILFQVRKAKRRKESAKDGCIDCDGCSGCGGSTKKSGSK